MTRWFLMLLVLTACSEKTCPTVAVKDWTRDEQNQILSEERKLPDNSILIPVIEDYAKLRREAR